MILRDIVVLMKNGDFEAVDCQGEDVFKIARVRDAGICGVFTDRDTANTFIESQRKLLERIVTGKFKAAETSA